MLCRTARSRMAAPSYLGRSAPMASFDRQVCRGRALLHFRRRFPTQTLPPALAMGYHLDAGTPVSALRYSAQLRDCLSAHAHVVPGLVIWTQFPLLATYGVAPPGLIYWCRLPVDVTGGKRCWFWG